MSTTVRAATLDDVPLLVDLMAEFHAEANYSLDRSWAARSFGALLADPSLGSAWLVLDGADAAGHAVLTVCHSMEYGGLAGYIDDLFVRPAFRRRGLGTRALETLFAECRRRSVLAVHVEVGEDNIAAGELYRAFGLESRNDRRRLLTVRLGDNLSTLLLDAESTSASAGHGE
jgi:ribosomal protein S18 acetylase RimI-like enzyme